jgi:hypothetical protein
MIAALGALRITGGFAPSDLSSPVNSTLSATQIQV